MISKNLDPQWWRYVALTSSSTKFVRRRKSAFANARSPQRLESVAPFSVAEHEEASESNKGGVDPFDAPNEFDRVVLRFARHRIVHGRGEAVCDSEIASCADHFDHKGTSGATRSLKGGVKQRGY